MNDYFFTKRFILLKSSLSKILDIEHFWLELRNVHPF